MNDAITGITEAPPTCQPDLQLLYMGYDLGTVVRNRLHYTLVLNTNDEFSGVEVSQVYE